MNLLSLDKLHYAILVGIKQDLFSPNRLEGYLSIQPPSIPY